MRTTFASSLAVLFTLLGAHVAAAGPEMRIAVMEFQSGGATGGDLESLGKGLQSMVTTDLSQVSSFQLVERSRLSDIQAEIKLSRTALVDKNTAVKIGKLAGATHLVTGTYTVVGGTMRIDTRLFTVADGKILLAEKIEGEKDAFFELEKDLVTKLIGAVGVKLAPKERAEVARVHTADFEAFHKFSDGVELFDEKKYDDAVAALKDASARDANFKLATVTLAEYERVITELRTKADAIEAASAQMEQLKADKSIQDEMKMIERLYAIAGKKNAPQIERLCALQALGLIYGFRDGYGHHEKLEKVQDEFALQRTADTIWRSYVAESTKVFPLVTLGISIESSGGLPRPATFDKDWPEFIERVSTFSAGGFSHEDSYLFFDLNYVNEYARRLGMDNHQELELRAKALELGKKLLPDKVSWQSDFQKGTAKLLRDVGEYGKSSALFSSLGAAEKEPYKLKELAQEIEKNRDLERVLAKAPMKKLAAELLLIMEDTWDDGVRGEMATRLATVTKPGAWDLYVLTRARRLSEKGDVLVDGVPVWQLRGSDESLATGPRTERLRATELRYYRGQPGRIVFLAVEGVPRKDLEARFDVDYTPPADWWPDENPGRNSDQPASPRPVVAARPSVAFVFGARDLVSEKRPMRSLQLVIDADAVHLDEVKEVEPRSSEGAKRAELSRQAIDLRGQQHLEVTVRIGGGQVVATVGGKTLTFKAPDDRLGFQGFQFGGTGFAAVKKMKLTGGAKAK